MLVRVSHIIVLLSLLLPAIVFCTDAVEYRRMADRCVASGNYAQAVEYYRSEAAIYRKLGDANAAKVEEMKAERWATEIEVFLDTPAMTEALRANDTGAKGEPAYGCYFGACLAYDRNLQRDNRPVDEAFAALTGKKLAVCYDYCRYGRRFPLVWARQLCRHAIAPQIAWEPEKLSAVRDDAYLRQFARDAASCGGPIFLRYACEMNGEWTPYHGNPALYRDKFRLVHQVMARLAPNVIMIWCVNAIPEENIARYYPGDEYVDWVGVNFYSVYYHDNNRARPAFFESPTSYLQYVYQRYAARKPIAICEYGATHRDNVDRIDRSDFATGKLTALLLALPRLFPRVKMIDLFDCNNIEYARPGRQLNNYCVTDSPQLLSALKRAVAPEYYLSRVMRGTPAAPHTYLKRVLPGTTVSGHAELSAWVKSYEEHPTVSYLLDGREITRCTLPADCRLQLATEDLHSGAHTLTLLVRDSKGRTAGRRDVAVSVDSTQS